MKTYWDSYRYYGVWPWTDECQGYYLTKDNTFSTRYGTEGQFLWDNLWKNDIMMGYEFQYRQAEINIHDEDENNELVAKYPTTKKNSAFWALYAQDQIQLRDNIAITLGINHDRYYDFGNVTNPRIAILYKFSSDSSVKLLYGQAFKSPSFYELYYTDDDTTEGNKDLNPEKMKCFEVGFEKNCSMIFWSRISVYYNIIDDLITQVTNEDDMLQFQNTDDVVSKGLEFDLRADSLYGVSFYLNMNYQSSKYIDSSEELSNSPKFVGNLGVYVPVWRDKVFIGTESRYVGRRMSIEPGIYIEPYFVSNLSIFAKKIHKNWNITARVYNILDNGYYDPGSGEHVMTGIQQDGRKYLIEVIFRF